MPLCETTASRLRNGARSAARAAGGLAAAISGGLGGGARAVRGGAADGAARAARAASGVLSRLPDILRRPLLLIPPALGNPASRRGAAGGRLALGIAFSLLALGAASSTAQETPPSSGPNVLENVSLGHAEGYTRLVFTFRDRLSDVVMRRADSDQLQADFGRAEAAEDAVAPRDEVIQGVEFAKDGENLVASLILATNHFDVRHFLSRDGYSLVVDVKPHPGADDGAGFSGPAPSHMRDQLVLEPPPLPDLLRALSFFVEQAPEPGSPESLVKDAITFAKDGDLDRAIELLEKFKAENPGHFYSDPALFLLGDLYFAKGLPDNYQEAADAWRSAVDTFPRSFEAPRAAFMLGEAARLVGYTNEAAGLYRLAAESYPESPWAPLAALRASDMSLAMNLNDDARKAVKAMAEKSPPDVWQPLALLRLAMADYQDTLYSQAVEKFRDALDRDPEIYELYPEMLYAMGDSYSYLDRPDLTALFLEHAVNLEPAHPKADVMLARIGNALQTMGLGQEAISFYKLAKDLFPDRDGGLVAQIRLADMGALSTFFKGDQVFDALERGARQATVRMYDQIISSASPSPLLQLAYLKVGQALAAEGDNSEAIKWLRELVTKYPKGILVDEARPILSRAVVNEASQRFDLGEYGKVEELNLDNSSFLEGPDRLRFLRLLAQSLERLDRPGDALEVWLQIEKDSPERRLADQKETIDAALAAGNPREAFEQIKKTASEFPEENDWLYGKLQETAMSFAAPRTQSAVEELLGFLDDPAVRQLPEISKLALSEAAAIEVENQNYDAASALMDRYRRDYPDDELSPEYLLTQAKMDRRQNRVDSYWNRLSEFRMRYPEDERSPLTVLETANDARKRDRLEDAWRYEELYRQIYPRDSLGRRMLLDRAGEQWNSARPELALDSWRLFQSEYPDDPAAPQTYLEAYRRLVDAGRPQEAFALLHEMRDRYGADPLSRDSYLAEYSDAIRAGRPDAAFAAFDEFRRQYPDDPRIPDLLLEKAKDLFAAGRPRDGVAAWADFMESFPDDPRNPELTLLAARQEYKDNLTQASLDHYRKYLEAYPQDKDRGEVLLEVAAIEGSLGQNEMAYNDLETFRREFTGHPEEAQATLDEIGYARAMGRVNEATVLYDVFREAFPSHPMFRQSFLDETAMLLESGRNGDALAILEDGIVRSPGMDDDKRVQDLLLSLYLNQNRVEDWAGAQEEFLRRDQNPQASLEDRFSRYTRVAQVYQELDRAGDAQRNFDLAMANKPPDAPGDALYTIAGGYKRMGLDDSYRQVLEVMSQLQDPLWQRVARQELAQT
ncbi:MAG: tetratricopeptide repeat protein [Deltaproteobacteria bacterium]|jgi:TolA-binding protein|nr:tetratricopeptide repeat protein [Deltaproteobacteria bacterium]